MKTLTLTSLSLLVSIACLAQDKYFTRDGHIKFFSATPMENIEGDNHKVTTVLDEATGKLEFSALMKSFEFEKALMEEHFNENYVESTKFPKAVFKGEIQGFDYKSTGAEAKEVQVKGSLTIHGVTKEITQTGTIQKKDGKYMLKSKFNVVPEDYKIEIPATVRDNIAKQMEVTVDVTLAVLSK